MSEQTVVDMKFPAACAQCGGRISEPVSFCPHCGSRARFASAARASHAADAVGGYPAAAAHFEPPIRSFAPTDFEGDLDTPGPDGTVSRSSPPSASPEGNRVRQPRVPPVPSVPPAMRRLGLKGGIGLVVAAFVLVYGGVTAVHRYDRPSTLSASDGGLTKSADGSMGSSDSNFTERAEQLRTLAPAAPLQGASGAALDAATPPAANPSATQTHPRRAGTAHGRRVLRSRAHGHKRTHAHTKYWRTPSPNTIYMHADAEPRRRSEQRGGSAFALAEAALDA